MFNSKRFSQLFFSQLAENKHFYLLFFSSAFFIAIICVIIGYITDSYGFTSVENQFNIYLFGLFFTGLLFAHFYFYKQSQLGAKIIYLMTPASVFEKIVCAFIITVPLYLILYTILFYCIDVPLVIINNLLVDYHNSSLVWILDRKLEKDLIMTYGSLSSFVYDSPHNAFEYNMIIYSYFVLQSFVIACSIYFVRFSFVKTILTGFLTVMLFISIVYLMALLNEDKVKEYISLFANESNVIQNSLFHISDFLLQFIFTKMLIVLFWLIAFFNLKEKEIV